MNILTRDQLRQAFYDFAEATCLRRKSSIFESMMPTINDLAGLMFIDIKLSDTEIQKELLQRVYIKLFRFMTHDRVRNIKNFSGYVRVCVLNENKMRLRSKMRYDKYKQACAWWHDKANMWEDNFKEV